MVNENDARESLGAGVNEKSLERRELHLPETAGGEQGRGGDAGIEADDRNI